VGMKYSLIMGLSNRISTRIASFIWL